MAVVSEKEENTELFLDYDPRININDLLDKARFHLTACVNYQDKKNMPKIVNLIFNKEINIKTLLNEPTDSYETALFCAVVYGNEELTKLFLQYGANVNAKNRDGKNSLHVAIEFNHVKIARLLIDNGARVNNRINYNFTILHEAIIQKSEESVQLLLNHGAKVNAKDNYGETPLHLLAKLNYLDEQVMDKIVKLLLDKGADINDFTNLGETAFHQAIINGNEKLVRLFLEYGAKVNMKNYNGQSPLHYAIQCSNKSIVKLLLDKGAEIEDRTYDGKLPLHIAIAVKDQDIIKILLEYNADVNATDKSGRTPLSLASKIICMRRTYNPWNGFLPMYLEIECDDDIFKLLTKYIAKLTYVCEENLKMINDYEYLKCFYSDCQTELNIMKKTKICGTITMYKMLTKNIDTIVGYTKNENLLKKLNMYAGKFPIYYQILMEKFYEAKSKKKLLEHSSRVFGLFITPFSLPDLVTNEILSYLSIEDLLNLQMLE